MPDRLMIAAPLLVLPSLLAAQVTQDTPGCSRLDIPERIAAINDLLDVPRLSEGLAQRGIGVDPVHALVSVRFDDQGAAEHVRVLASSVDSLTDQAVRDALAGAVVPQPAADPWGVRVLLVLGEAPSLLFERAELCPPEPLNLSLSARPPPVVEGAEPVRLRLLVNEVGRVERVTVIQGSGEASVDEQVQAHWRRMLFSPGTLDGIPIAATVEVSHPSPDG